LDLLQNSRFIAQSKRTSFFAIFETICNKNTGILRKNKKRIKISLDTLDLTGIC
jgi:hypothetical protein